MKTNQLFQHFLNRISSHGILEDTPNTLRKKLKILNLSLTGLAGICFFYFVLCLFNKLFLSALVTSTSFLFVLISFYFIRIKKYNFVFHSTMCYGLLFLASVIWLDGSWNYAYFYFIFIPIASNILFDKKTVIIFYLIVSIVCLISDIHLLIIYPSYNQVSGAKIFLGYPNIIFAALLIYAAVRLFKNENLLYSVSIEFQNEVLEEKNREIMDSITYAKRIQNTLLASETLLKENLPEYFILYKPKAVVSGDFYWASKVSDTNFLLLTGDCTGHGVPGAFMSLLNMSVLREIIMGQNIYRPDQILNLQRDTIINALNSDAAADQSRDGMDCVLCSFDFTTRKVQFSCANNPIWILRGNEIITFKRDKQPIGLHVGNPKDYTLQTFDLHVGDIVYTFTDGFADQFGGPRGKKFKYGQLKKQFISINKQSMSQQKSILENTFNTWKGSLEQVDDVLVIGIKIK